jgi:DNA-binding GntR family transcriptional regulator
MLLMGPMAKRTAGTTRAEEPAAGRDRRAERGAFPDGVSRVLKDEGDGALYRRLYEALRDGILDNAWKPGDLLPSEAAIGARYGVSRITVRHALQLLQFDGYIRTQRAHRAIVLAREPLLQSGYAVDTIDDLIQAASAYRLQIASWRREREPDAARILELPPSSALHCLRGVLLADGHRLARVVIYFHPSVGGRLKLGSFDDPVVFRILQRELGVRLSDVKMTVWADLALEEDARELGCRVGSAMFCSRLVYRNDERMPVEVTYSRSPAALRRYSFDIEVDPA